MTARVLAAAVVGLALLAPACGGDATVTPPPTTAASGGPTTTTATTGAVESLARYTRTGGVAGRRFEVVVRPDGTFEGGSGKPGRGHLGSDALDELRRLVTDFTASRPDDRYGQANPDVFVTTIMAGETTTTVLSGGEPPRPVQALLSFLAGLERQLPR